VASSTYRAGNVFGLLMVVEQQQDGGLISPAFQHDRPSQRISPLR
jgi:hypothetical protein